VRAIMQPKGKEKPAAPLTLKPADTVAAPREEAAANPPRK
jgi:hypothetical protein